MANNTNGSVGLNFEKKVKGWFEKKYGESFELQKKIPIGSPPKGHRFDIANQNNKIVIECKCYAWTRGGNPPSAKLSVLNEALFYFSFVHSSIKILVMKKDINVNTGESLAQYYYRTNKPFISDVLIYEYDEINDEMNILN